jgi:hypothetical protein
MPIRYEGDAIEMDGYCPIDDAEELMKFLEEHPTASVSLERCQHMHSALLQLLLSYRVRVVGEAYTPFIWKWVVPLLKAHGG